MRRSRLATGFHRIGLALAVPTTLSGGAMLVAARWSSTPEVPNLFGYALLAGALLLYALAWGIGWIVRGFAGEDVARPAPVSLGAAAVSERAVPSSEHMPWWRRLLCIGVGGVLLYGSQAAFTVAQDGAPKPDLMYITGFMLLVVGGFLAANGVNPERFNRY